MALPLLLGLAGSALAPTIGMSALAAGALGSGLGSLAQGDDLQTAIGTGLTSYFGGKLLGPAFAKAGIGSTPGVAAPSAAAVGPMPAAVGTEAAIDAALSPKALALAGSGALANQVMKPPKPFDMSDDYPDIPEAEAAKRRMMTPGPDYRPGIDPEFRFFQPMQEGGIAELDDRSSRIQELLRKGMNKQLMMNDKELISKVATIIKSSSAGAETSEEAKMILGQFLNKYGEQALRDLAERVQSGEFDQNAMVDEGMVNGVGDGMDDMIPATLEGEQDVVLSDGEFIVPADVVSGLGNGSSDAGAKSLYEMMDRVREMRTGMAEQPEQVPQGMMLPA